MSETPAEDSVSVHSDDTIETSALKEKLENLSIQESKHSHNYYDLHTRDNFTRLDVENVNNLCQRYEEQKKKKCEILEDFYDKLAQTHAKNMAFLKDKMKSVSEQLEQVNSLFCEAYEDYSSEVLRNTINYLDNETKQLEKVLSVNEENLRNSQLVMEQSLMKPKSSVKSVIDNAIDLLFESSMKRPEIELEEISAKLIDHSIPMLRKQLEDLLSKPE